MTDAFRFWRYFLVALVVQAVLLGLNAPARAQEVPPNLPDPSKLEEQFKEHALPQSKVILHGTGSEEARAAPKSSVRFTLTSVAVSGATVFGPDVFQPFYGKYLGRDVSLADIYDIAAAMTAFYRNKGYILSRVVVPAQEVAGGQVALRAVEGAIDKVTIDGDVPFGRHMLERMGEKIRAARPLTAAVLERYILLMNDLAGVNAQAVLSPSETPGMANLSVVVGERRYSVLASSNNHGSRYTGPVQIQAGLDLHSVLGPMSRTSLRVAGASQLREFKFFEVGHEQPLGHEGTVLALKGRRTLSRPGDTLADLDIYSRSTSGSIELRHPIIRSRAKSLYVRAGLDIRNTRTSVLGEAYSADRVRKAYAGVSVDFVDHMHGVNLIDIEVGRGLNILKATETGSPNTSRADANSQFLKLNATFTRLQRIVPRVNLLIDVTGQYTADGLPASEEMALGGGQYGRAFDPSEITGDRGVAGRVELRFDGRTKSRFLTGYQLYGFADYGAVWNRTDTGYDMADLASVGAGVRFRLAGHVSAYAEVAHATEKTPDYLTRYGNGVRGFFGVTLRF